jgi:diacylglycerol kinase family enzyme
MIAGAARHKAVLIVNPNAGRLSQDVHDEVIAALRARFELEAYSTSARDTGIALAADAAEAGAELVIAFGGDGHVNEVVNGLVGSDSTLGIVPGGTMNVFARALGVPLDPFDAVEYLREAMGRPARRVNLGRAGGRYFTFAAGCGFDAEAAERVGRYVPAKRRLGEAFYFWSAFRVLAAGYRHRRPTMTLRHAGGEEAVVMAIACKTGPYAYLFGRPVQLTPRVELGRGLDVFALRAMRIEALPSYVVRTAVLGDLSGHPDAIVLHDLERCEIVAERPFHRHVDGEALPPTAALGIELVRGALWVRV